MQVADLDRATALKYDKISQNFFKNLLTNVFRCAII